MPRSTRVPAKPASPVSPFTRGADVRLSLSDRVLRRERPDIGAAALRNLLAAKFPGAPSGAAVRRIVTRCRIPGPRVAELLSALYREAYVAFAADGVVSDAEDQYLGALRAALGLSAAACASVVRDAGGERLESAMRRVLESDEISERTGARITKIARGLRLSDAAASEVRSRVADEFLRPRLDAATAARRISPRALAAHVQAAEWLGARLIDGPTQDALRRYALYWRVEHGQLPSVDAPVRLEKGERCHFSAFAMWSERPNRRPAQAKRAEPAPGLRIARGASHCVEWPAAPQRLPAGAPRPDTGVVYITSHRVLLTGGTRSVAQSIDTLVAFHAYANGVVLERPTGPSLIVRVVGDAELAAVVLSRIMNAPDAEVAGRRSR